MVGFSNLWQNYPHASSPCSTNGSPNFTNQCAIRMGVCLEAASVKTGKFNVARCWYHPREAGHILRAEDLQKCYPAVVFPGLVGLRNTKARRGSKKFKSVQASFYSRITGSQDHKATTWICGIETKSRNFGTR